MFLFILYHYSEEAHLNEIGLYML